MTPKDLVIQEQRREIERLCRIIKLLVLDANPWSTCTEYRTRRSTSQLWILRISQGRKGVAITAAASAKSVFIEIIPYPHSGICPVQSILQSFSE